MTNVIDFIHDRLSRNRFILVYSLKNDQIDSTIILCYLMKYGHMEPKKAIQAIYSKRTNEFNNGLLFKTFIFKFYTYIREQI